MNFFPGQMGCCKARQEADGVYFFVVEILAVVSLILFISFWSFLALFRFWRQDTVAYEIPSHVQVSLLYTDTFYIAGNKITGLQNMSLGAGEVWLQDVFSVSWDDVIAHGPISMEEWNSGGFIIKGNTFFESSSDGNLTNNTFVITTGVTLTGNSALTVPCVSCGGFLIAEGKLLNEDGLEITWPAPGESVDSGTQPELLESTSRVPYLGGTEIYGKCVANLSMQVKCRSLKANYDGFACLSDGAVVFGKCSNICCGELERENMRVNDVKAIAVFGRRRLAVLTNDNVLRIYDRGEIVEQIEYVMDIQAVGKELLYSRDFLLYVWSEKEKREIARNVKEFTASSYRNTFVIGTDCDSDEKTSMAEVVCNPHRFEVIQRLSKSEIVYVVNKELIVCKDGVCEKKLKLLQGESITSLRTRDNRVVFAIYSERGVVIRKLLKNGKLTEFRLRTDQVDEVVMFPGPNKLPRLFIRTPNKVSVVQCENDVCIPFQMFR